MFATPAFAQAAGAAPTGGGLDIATLALPVAMIVLFYFLLIRPQQRRAKEQQELIKGIKRGDTVVLTSGIIGKVTRVEDTEIQVEIASGVSVKVVKSMVSTVRTRGEPAPANDAKA